DQYFLDYAKMFDLNTVVFRHSTIYGSRQFSTFNQGWIGWFCQKAFEIKNRILKDKLTISGNGKQVRDILFIDDAVNLYFMTAKKINTLKGEVFNIGGGIDNSISILELFDILEKKLNIQLKYEKLKPRAGDQKFFVTNIDKAKNLIKWRPEVFIDEGIDKMIEWISFT
ncbi:MAG: NAD-dependent epimerase/dehydratase family protein, partial [Candidatus Hodarchaeota archaeon]